MHGFRGKKSCFSGKLQREKLLLCRGRTCAARSCKVNGHLREGRGPVILFLTLVKSLGTDTNAIVSSSFLSER